MPSRSISSLLCWEGGQVRISVSISHFLSSPPKRDISLYLSHSPSLFVYPSFPSLWEWHWEGDHTLLGRGHVR